jgi:hypothetical protein
LLDTTKQPRIILAGGSNLALGIDSKMIQDSTGYNVVNLALHAGLGLEYIINEVKMSVKENDIVILSIEHFLGLEGDYLLMKETVKNYPEANNFFTRNLYTEIKSYFERELTKNFKRNISFKKKPYRIDTTEIYSRFAFNKYGDNVKHLTRQAPENIKGRGKIGYIYWDGIEYLNEFYDYATGKSIDVYFTFANYPLSEYEKNIEVFSRYESDVKNNLKMKVLNNIEDFIFADSLFFDSTYHLNKEGRYVRTIKLINILKRNKICKVKTSSP